MSTVVEYSFKAKEVFQDGRTTWGEIEAVLKQQLQKDDGENVPPLTDEQIVNFLLSCDGDPDLTRHTIEKFYAARRRIPRRTTSGCNF